MKIRAPGMVAGTIVGTGSYGGLKMLDQSVNISGLYSPEAAQPRSMKEIADSNQELPGSAQPPVESLADLMSPEQAERYLKFLENGSMEGLTDAEIAAIRNVDEALALKKVDGQSVLELRRPVTTGKHGIDTVVYRRVQGGSGNNASQVRIEVNEDGTINIPNKDINLSISIDNGEHAEYFLNKRGGDAQIVEIEVPKWFDDFLRENAIPQVNYKINRLNQDGTAPKITDISTPGNCFELPAPWIEWLEEYGSNARIISP